MNLDELPIEVLLVLVLFGWAGYFALIAWEARHNREAHLAQRRDEGSADHEPEHDEAEGHTEQPAQPDQDDDVVSGSHARRLAR